MSTQRDRVISINLSEEEWRAFVARQPQPVDWLRAQIRSEVERQDAVRIAQTEIES